MMRYGCIFVLICLALISPLVSSVTDRFLFDQVSTNMPLTPMVATEITASTTYQHSATADLVVVVVPHNTTSSAGIVDESFVEIVDYVLEKKIKSVLRFSSSGGPKLLVVELADEEDEGILGRKLATSIATALKSEKDVSDCTVLLPSGFPKDPSFLTECSSSILSAFYVDTRYKSVDDEAYSTPLERIEFVSSTLDADEAKKALRNGSMLASGVYIAKDIVNAPHSSLNSLGLANLARYIAGQSRGRLTCRILDKTDCERRGMGAFLGVARGSETPPQFIHLTYRPPRRNKPLKRLGIVGKGLLMDTGGYSIKTSMMELMKFDCGGSAACLGAAMAVALMEPEGVEVHFVIAACENMINERAQVPGDIVMASNGKTIEVINTDAEGRLTMADALVFADKEMGCDQIVELSTLTGSCIGALGQAMSGIWTADDTLLDELKAAAKVSGEKLWHMPLEKEYNDMIKSKIADLKNVGGRYGGAITAALFLTNFIDNKPYAHIDMAGPVWNTKSGATGWGAKLLTEFICKHATS